VVVPLNRLGETRRRYLAPDLHHHRVDVAPDLHVAATPCRHAGQMGQRDARYDAPKSTEVITSGQTRELGCGNAGSASREEVAASQTGFSYARTLGSSLALAALAATLVGLLVYLIARTVSWIVHGYLPQEPTKT
jgi:hypothetical protein